VKPVGVSWTLHCGGLDDCVLPRRVGGGGGGGGGAYAIVRVIEVVYKRA